MEMALHRCSAGSANALAQNLSSQTYCSSILRTGVILDDVCTFDCARFCTDPRILFSEQDIFASCLALNKQPGGLLDPFFASEDFEVILGRTHNHYRFMYARLLLPIWHGNTKRLSVHEPK